MARSETPPGRSNGRRRWGAVLHWTLWVALAGGLLGFGVWLFADTPTSRFLVRVYQDREFLRRTLEAQGLWAPVIFVAIQALQVVIAPIPGELTGFLGGYIFGQWLGFLYSTIGLTVGSLGAFWVGRQLGEPFVRRLVSQETWARMGFLVRAEGTLLCLIVYLIPGLPKDVVCYIFGLSPMPFRVFAIVSSLGRMPGTWVLSAQGAKSAHGQFVELALLTAVTVAVAVPLWYYRHRLVAWFHGPVERRSRVAEPGEGL